MWIEPGGDYRTLVRDQRPTKGGTLVEFSAEGLFVSQYYVEQSRRCPSQGQGMGETVGVLHHPYPLDMLAFDVEGRGVVAGCTVGVNSDHPFPEPADHSLGIGKRGLGRDIIRGGTVGYCFLTRVQLVCPIDSCGAVATSC